MKQCSVSHFNWEITERILKSQTDEEKYQQEVRKRRNETRLKSWRMITIYAALRHLFIRLPFHFIHGMKEDVEKEKLSFIHIIHGLFSFLTLYTSFLILQPIYLFAFVYLFLLLITWRTLIMIASFQLFACSFRFALCNLMNLMPHFSILQTTTYLLVGRIWIFSHYVLMFVIMDSFV